MKFYFYIDMGIVIAVILTIAICAYCTRPKICKRHMIAMKTGCDKDPFSAPNIVTPPPTYRYCPECKKEKKEQT